MTQKKTIDVKVRILQLLAEGKTVFLGPYENETHVHQVIDNWCEMLTEEGIGATRHHAHRRIDLENGGRLKFFVREDELRGTSPAALVGGGGLEAAKYLRAGGTEILTWGVPVEVEVIAPRYRKKPVEIEAMQWDGTAAGATPIINWVLAGDGTARYDDASSEHGEHIAIDTLEGTMRAVVGDFIIRGVESEFYPCKPDIFAKTYDAIEEASA